VPADAIALISRALALRPDHAPALNNLGNALKNAGRTGEAEAAYRRAIALNLAFADPLENLGSLLHSQHRIAEARAVLRKALELRPNRPKVLNDLACIALDLGEATEAEALLRRALAADPALAEAVINLAQLLRDQGRLEEAEQLLRPVLARTPSNADARNVLANVLRVLGRLEEAEEHYRLAVAAKPDDAGVHSNLLFLLNYLPKRSAAEIYTEHLAFGKRFAAVQIAPHGNAPDPGRRLRVGYVSADFRDHPVAFFLEPVLACHDRSKFEVYCYYNFGREDAFTQRLRALADVWRPVHSLTVAEFADQVRRDGIDILIDLGGHTGYNRLEAFAHRPAPVQATWLGYLNTTGLATMDARITDRYASPPGLFDDFHTEPMLRVPGCQWCYRPATDSPDVSPPPMLKSGDPTFGVFSNPAKLSEPILRLWASVLARLPRARLIVAGAMMANVPEAFRRRFAACGLTPDRVTLLPAKRFNDYLAMHGEVDIVLDTQPYSGGTTTCHSLWMGVPVVTLAGETATSRGSASLLHAVGLKTLIAETPARYVEIAALLASDAKRLAQLRSGMRARMKKSPLMDEAGFTRNLEAAYRKLWRNWCAARAA
jgi:predicted O-linked N-acetylglucosamine transferase (SPINDLY family)